MFLSVLKIGRVFHNVRRSKHRSVSAMRRKLHSVSSFFLFRLEPAALGFKSVFVMPAKLLFKKLLQILLRRGDGGNAEVLY